MRFTMYVISCLLPCLMLMSGFGEGGICVPRDFGWGSVVCVCNATYCDDFDQIMATEQGYLQVYTSSKDGLRFDSQTKKMDTCDNDITGSTEVLRCSVNPGRTKQTIVGFGGAFTDAAGININSLSSESRSNLMASYFSTSGIEYTVGRIPMGSTDFSTHFYTYQDDPDAPFSLASEDYEYKIPLIKMANSMSTRGIRYFGSPWIAPTWMRNNNQIKDQNIDNYQVWAEYFIKFIRAYAHNGVKIWGLTTQNEPFYGHYAPETRLNASAVWMQYMPLQLFHFATNFLGPTLKFHNLSDIQMMIFDDNLNFLFLFESDIDDALNELVCSSYIDGLAIHWYTNNYANYKTTLTGTHTQCPNMFILATEACVVPHGEVAVKLGDWKNAQDYAYDIIKDLQNWVSGWTDWNLALDPNGGPNWIQNFVDSPVIVNSTEDAFYKQPMFYALGHFSKFIPPGFRVVDVSCSFPDESIEMTAAVKLANDTINKEPYNFVIVVLNRGDEAKSVELDIHNVTVCLNILGNTIQTYIWNI